MNVYHHHANKEAHVSTNMAGFSVSVTKNMKGNYANRRNRLAHTTLAIMRENVRNLWQARQTMNVNVVMETGARDAKNKVGISVPPHGLRSSQTHPVVDYFR